MLFAEVRFGGQGTRMLEMEGCRYKLWWSGKGDGVGGVGVMEKGELCQKAVVVIMVSDRVMNIAVVF